MVMASSLQQLLPLERGARRHFAFQQHAGIRITAERREYTSSSAVAGCSGRVRPASGRLTSSSSSLFAVVAVSKASPWSSSASFKSSPRLKDAKTFACESLHRSYRETVADGRIPGSYRETVADGRIPGLESGVKRISEAASASSSVDFERSAQSKDSRRFIRQSLKRCHHEVGADEKSSVLESVERFIQDGRCKQTAMAAAVFMALSFLHEGAVNAEAMVGFAPVAFPWQKEGKEQQLPSRGNCATCIGVVDETLGACSARANCVSSFDDRPRFFVAPWEFPGKLPFAVEKLKDVLLSSGANIEDQGERYVHAVFTSKDGVVDDVEFLFSNPREDATVVVRSASRAINMDDNQRNRNRLEEIRKSLTWEQVPVLRNRKRFLFFLESPWDTFGPEPPPTFEQARDSLEFVPE